MPGHDKKDEPELPTRDLQKDAALAWSSKGLNRWYEHSTNAVAKEWLGLHDGGNIFHEGVSDHPVPGIAIDQHDVATPHPQTGAHELKEANETVAKPLDWLAEMENIDGIGKGDLKHRLNKGADTLIGGAGLGAMGETMESAAPWLTFGKQVFDVTRAGSESLKTKGVFGRDEDGNNRDASEWAAHAGHEIGDAVGGSLAIRDGKLVSVGHSDSIVGWGAGLVGTLGASLVSGEASFYEGSRMVKNELGEKMSLDRVVDMKKATDAAETTKAQNDLLEEEDYKKRLAAAQGDKRKDVEREHIERQIIKHFGWDEE